MFATAVAMAGGSLAAPPATTPPILFSLESATPRTMADGAHKSWPIAISEDTAMAAVFSGGMWVPDPSGGREYARYVRHILHANGTWTWIGSVQSVHGPQSVVLTFGKDSVYGVVPQQQGYPLRITTADGQSRVVQTSAAAMAQSTLALRLRSRPDYLVPPTTVRGPQRTRVAPVPEGAPARSGGSNTAHAQAAAQNSTTTIDVMVAYTPGLVSGTGSVTAALTRIQYLVDYTNQAYVNSGVNARIRLVHTVEVDYPDNTSNESALEDLTGLDGNGNTVPVPASLQAIAALRSQYGADLVALVRAYDYSTQDGCGMGWLVGGNEQQIDPGYDSVWGYSVVSDGTSSNDGTNWYCLDSTLAHELGHNMGSAHDRANAPQAGAYPYSYGYIGNGDNGFATIMAYGSSEQTPLQVFSNPDIATCENTPCGVADNASDSADNAHSMNNTAGLIAQFEPTEVDTPVSPLDYVHNDVNADGKSDLFWFSDRQNKITYWLMNGADMTAWRGFGTSNGYHPVASGDFNGDHRADLLLDNDQTHRVYMWLGNGDGTFTSKFLVTHRADSSIAGTGDVDGDGNSDIIWFVAGSHQATYWLMDGSTMLSWRGFSIPGDYHPAGVGDFNGDGRADILWGDSNRHLYMWLNDGNGGFGSDLVTTHKSGWAVAGVGDANGDGKSDIFWYNQGTGHLTYWLMDGDAMKSWRGFKTSSSNHVAGIGDYNGNGRADVLWNEPDSRNLSTWLDDGQGAFTSQFITHYSTSFAPAN